MKTERASVWRTLGIVALAAVIPASGWAFGGPCGGGRMGPPQGAIDACAGKKAGDEVRFQAPCGDNVAAICRETGSGLVAVPAGGRGRGGTGMGPGRHFARMASELNLTKEQEAKIRAVLDAEREKAAPLRRQLMENREKMRQLAETVPYDEAAVRALAASQEKTRVELIVSRTRAMNQAFALLTPEQQAKAKQLRPFGDGRPGGGPR
ncbi:MAG: Spy/CpxP family protein refolding chaperone, partial [Verrucomicrobiota bacterium]